MSKNIFEPPRIPVDFGFTDEHGLAREQARRFLAERCPLSHVRAMVDDPKGYDPALYREIAEMGWVGLVTPEAHGGLGLDHLHLALLMDEMGRVLLPSPYFASLSSLLVLEQAASPAQQARWIAAITSGELIATTALSEPGLAWEPGAVATLAEVADGGYLLRGTLTHVLFAQSAGLLLVPCRDPNDELAVFAVELPTTGVTMTAEVGIDSTRRMARVELDGVRVGAEARLEPEGRTALEALARAELAATAALSAEMVGGIESVLEITRRYAIERKQFGRAIGSFQAVKHPIVDIMTGLEQARSQAFGAAATLDHDPERAEQLCRMAKALAGDVYHFAANRGVQLHGGFGFTWDCDVHFYMKRAMWSNATLGSPRHQRAQLARMLFDGDANLGAPSQMTMSLGL